jgi:hypothetical protein
MILKLALTHKGAPTDSGHYDLAPSQRSTTNERSAIDDEEGVHL